MPCHERSELWNLSSSSPVSIETSHCRGRESASDSLSVIKAPALIDCARTILTTLYHMHDEIYAATGEVVKFFMYIHVWLFLGIHYQHREKLHLLLLYMRLLLGIGTGGCCAPLPHEPRKLKPMCISRV